MLNSINIIAPAPGCSLRCRNGHVGAWDPRILPTADGQKAKVVAVRCAICGHHIRLDDKSFLEGSGKKTALVYGKTADIISGSEYDGASEY